MDELPKYRATRDLRPPTFARVRFEAPWTSSDSPDVFQYTSKPISAGEIVETDCWPHDSFWPLNEPAKRVLHFYRSALRSRLGLKPYNWNGELSLDDGVSGKTAVTHVAPPQLTPWNGNAA